MTHHIFEALLKKGLEDPLQNAQIPEAQKYIETRFEDIFYALGLNRKDANLANTPERIAKMYCTEVLKGIDYENFPDVTTFPNDGKYDEMVSCRCTVTSLCSHHFVPFSGIAHVAYIPKDKVLGLSKFNRVVDFYSRRPQIQERLTLQICAALETVLETPDIAVVIRAEHSCVRIRGIQDHNSETVTSKMGGRFMSVPELRQEFLALTR